MLVEELPVDCRTNRSVDVVGTHPLEDGQRRRADDLDLAERGEVDDAGALPYRVVFILDSLEPVRPGPTVLTREPSGPPPRIPRPMQVCALPAGLGAEDRPRLLEPTVKRR